MNEPKYQVGQEVEATYRSSLVHESAIVKGVRLVYRIEFTSLPGITVDRDEDQIHERRPSPEEAWEKATMLIGIRSREKGEYCCMDGQEKLDFDKYTRHQVYQILGSASIRITDEVKRDVRRLIGVADGM